MSNIGAYFMFLRAMCTASRLERSKSAKSLSKKAYYTDCALKRHPELAKYQAKATTVVKNEKLHEEPVNQQIQKNTVFSDVTQGGFKETNFPKVENPIVVFGKEFEKTEEPVKEESGVKASQYLAEDICRKLNIDLDSENFREVKLICLGTLTTICKLSAYRAAELASEMEFGISDSRIKNNRIKNNLAYLSAFLGVFSGFRAYGITEPELYQMADPGLLKITIEILSRMEEYSNQIREAKMLEKLGTILNKFTNHSADAPIENPGTPFVINVPTGEINDEGEMETRNVTRDLQDMLKKYIEVHIPQPYQCAYNFTDPTHIIVSVFDPATKMQVASYNLQHGSCLGKNNYHMFFQVNINGIIDVVLVDIVKNQDLVKEYLNNPGLILTKEQADKCVADGMVNGLIYHFIDLKDVKMENMIEATRKEFETNLMRISSLPWQNLGVVDIPRMRVKDFRASNDFVLVADEKTVVYFPDQSQVFIPGLVVRFNFGQIVVLINGVARPDLMEFIPPTPQIVPQQYPMNNGYQPMPQQMSTQIIR